jgi:hypothetical protein
MLLDTQVLDLRELLLGSLSLPHAREHNTVKQPSREKGFLLNKVQGARVDYWRPCHQAEAS